MNAPAHPYEIDDRTFVEVGDATDLLLPGQEEADLALLRANAALEDLALALHGRPATRRHFRDRTLEVSESFLRLARAS